MSWLQLKMPSMFHTYYTVHESRDRKLFDADFDYAVIVQLLPKPADLYALQIGFRGGSRYEIFKAEREDGLIETLTMLDPKCIEHEGVQYRESPPVSVLSTGYCAVNSMSGLIAIARDAQRRTPIGTLTWITEAPESDGH